MVPQWPEGVHWLIEAGADVNKRSGSGETPMEVALSSENGIHRNGIVFAMLCNAGAKISGSGLTKLLHWFPTLPYSHSLDSCVWTENIDDNDTVGAGKLVMDLSPLVVDTGDVNGYRINEARVLRQIANLDDYDLLKHQIVEAFLLLKWNCIRKYYFSLLCFYLLYACVMTTTIIMGLNEENRYIMTSDNKSHDIFQEEDMDFLRSSRLLVPCGEENCFSSLFYITIVLFVVNIFLSLGIFGNMLRLGVEIIFYIDYHVEAILVGATFMVLLCYLNVVRTVGLRHFEAIVLLLVWAKLLLAFGKIPKIGAYIAMFTKVGRDIMKFLAVYSILLLAFAMAFNVLFYSQPVFRDPLLAVMKAVVMMVGEYEFQSIFLESTPSVPGTAHVIFIGFVFFVGVVLLNLLVGLAVSDITKLKADSEVTRMCMQVDLVHGLSEFFDSWFLRMVLPRAILSHIRNNTLLTHHLKGSILTVDLYKYEFYGSKVKRKGDRILSYSEFRNHHCCGFLSYISFILKTYVIRLVYFFCRTPKDSSFPELLSTRLVQSAIGLTVRRSHESIKTVMKHHSESLKAKNVKAGHKEGKENRLEDIESNINEIRSDINKLLRLQESLQHSD